MIGIAFVIAFGRAARVPRADPVPPARPADAWFARDKAFHFAASALIQGAAHAAFRARGADYGAASRGAAVVTLTAGIGKEVWDHYHPGHDASARDLAWDVAGGATAAVVARRIDR
ncbi:MAG TPA: hypothetical protein VG916_02290 [Gemmatimonadaceae bacterium]|nr:hypothetical protein [Gemmatimonadaceae bacterium]